MKHSFYQLALILSLVCLSAAQISIPLTRRSIQTGTEYEQEAFYTFNLEVKTKESQSLPSIIDLHQSSSWFVDKECKNCFSAPNFAEGAFSCQDTCGPILANDPAISLVGGKIKSIKNIVLNPEATIQDTTVTLNQVKDIILLKDGNLLEQQKLYLNQIRAGVGFSYESAADSKSVLHQIFEKEKVSPRQISLFFNPEMGRLLIGKKENFFGKDGTVFKTVKDETEPKSSWSLKIGPQLWVGEAPPLSTQVNENPSSAIADLHSSRMDSTTKYVKIPLAAWNRLDKTLFYHNGCNEDAIRSKICDCTGSWESIKFKFVKNPEFNTLEDNTQEVLLKPDHYLEKIESGKNSGKCLLLIKGNDGDANLDYVFGTSFLSNYYSVYNFDDNTILLANTHGLVPSEMNIDSNYAVPFAIVGGIVAVGGTAALLAILTKVKAPTEAELKDAEEQQKNRIPQSKTTISYIVKSPRPIDSVGQITNSAAYYPQHSPSNNRIINSPSNHYSQHNIVYQQ